MTNLAAGGYSEARRMPPIPTFHVIKQFGEHDLSDAVTSIEPLLATRPEDTLENELEQLWEPTKHGLDTL